MQVVIREILRRMVRRVGDTSLLAVLVVLAVLLLVCRASAAQYEFAGAYRVQDVFTAYCEDCYLELPPEFLAADVVLAVKTDNDKTFRQALKKSARAVGWELQTKGRYFVANPIQNSDNLVYLSCLTNEPVNVPKYLYSWAVKSDSIKCYLQKLEQSKKDSLFKIEQTNKNKLDSLSKIRLPFISYKLEYYSYTKNFADKLGAEFGGVVALGNLHDKFQIFDDWKFYASTTNDTTFTFRSIDVAFDSSLSVDWGTEEQTLKTSYVTANGIVNNDYEWRKYGLLVTMQKDTARVRLSYVFRDKEANISVLQGQAVGNLGDTIRVSGQYNTSRVVTIGIPWLSSIPIIKYLVSTEQVLTDIKQFELYLIPKKAGTDEYTQDTTATAADTTTTTADTLVSR